MVLGLVRDLFTSKEAKEISLAIIKDWEENPDDWKVGDYTVVKGSLEIWVANSPYADMTIRRAHLPLKNKLRKAFFELQIAQAKEQLLKK